MADYIKGLCQMKSMNMKIRIQFPADGPHRSFSVSMSVDSTIAILKQKIHERTGLLESEYSLFRFAHEISNGSTVFDVSSRANQRTMTVIVVYSHMDTFLLNVVLHSLVRYSAGRKVSLTVNQNDTLADVERRLRLKVPHHITGDYITFKRRSYTLNKENSLSEIHIGPGRSIAAFECLFPADVLSQVQSQTSTLVDSAPLALSATPLKRPAYYSPAIPKVSPGVPVPAISQDSDEPDIEVVNRDTNRDVFCSTPIPESTLVDLSGEGNSNRMTPFRPKLKPSAPREKKFDINQTPSAQDQPGKHGSVVGQAQKEKAKSKEPVPSYRIDDPLTGSEEADQGQSVMEVSEKRKNVVVPQKPPHFKKQRDNTGQPPKKSPATTPKKLAESETKPSAEPQTATPEPESANSSTTQKPETTATMGSASQDRSVGNSSEKHISGDACEIRTHAGKPRWISKQQHFDTAHRTSLPLHKPRRNRGRGSRGRPQNPPNQQGTLKLDDFTVQCCTVSKDAKSIKKFWVKTVSGRYTPVTFQVDTGADTTLISSEVFTDQFPQFKLKQLAARLSSVDGTPIKGHKGTFTTRICFGGRTSIGDLHVVSGIKNNILGKNFLRPLAVQIDCSSNTIAAIQVSKEELLKEFPQLIDDNMGTYQGTPHRIQLSPNAIPFAARLRPIPLALREAAIKEVKEMDRLGVWKPVDHSDWAHPMVTVPKKTGGARITTDLTKLNNFVVPERFPLPRIKDLICNLSGSTVFSKLDLKKGYFHIPLHPDSQPLTITITPLGLRMYTRLPMGLKDSASAFQKRVQEALQGLPGVEPYIDDIVVHGKNTEEHDMRLRGVLSRLQNKGFKLQISKVSIGQHQVAAFGFLISANGVKPDPANVKPILDAPIPATVKQVQRFLGMVNYFSEFLPDIASLAEPLRKLTRSEEKYNWGATQELAFNTIKQALAHLAELQIFDPTADIIVTTDASDIGIGAMLSQQLPDQKEKPVAFFSKTLSPAERNYAASEKEALAAIRACEHWEHLIWGQPFTLRTDHQALRQILSSSKDRRQSSKFQRWKERLDEFNFKIEYLPGPDNAPADYLSRLESRAEELGLKSKDLTVAGIRMEQIQDLTSLDEELQAVIKALQTGQWKKLQIPDVAVLQSNIRIKEHLSFKDGILFQGRKIIPPVELRRPILEAIHIGHPGIVRTKNSLRTTYWWPGADGQVESLIKNCQPCQLSSKTAKTPTPKGISIPRPSKAGEQWALDITGPFYNGQYLVVLIDYYSRFPELLQTKDISSNSIIKWLEDLWDRIGNPTALVSDNGPQFVSQAFTDFLQSRDIHHFTTSVYNPQENGLVEVFNRYLKHGIQTFAQNNWTQGLKNLLLSYRTTPGDTGRSPADLFFGRIIRPSWKPNLQKPRRRTRKQQHFDTAHRTSLPLHKPHQGYSVFKKGDKVLKRIRWAPKGISPWKGPFIVERVLGTYTFLLSDGQVWSSRNLKPWIQSRVPADQWVDDDLPPFVGDLPPHLQPPIPVLRRSTRANQGRPPKRYACERLTGG